METIPDDIMSTDLLISVDDFLNLVSEMERNVWKMNEMNEMNVDVK
jgi:hypothetical protein